MDSENLLESPMEAVANVLTSDNHTTINDLQSADFSTYPFANGKDSSLNDATFDSISGDEIGSEVGGSELEEDAPQVDDIDKLLENPIGDVPENLKNAFKFTKRVLVYRGQDHFDVLPDGWVEVTHSSGMPVYLHKKSRCCTFSRPYFIGPASVRLHRVPESAIPCLFYKRLQVEAEQRESEALEKSADDNGRKDVADSITTSIENNKSTTNGGSEGSDVVKSDGKPPIRSDILQKIKAPEIRVKTADDLLDTQMTPDALYEYARRRIKFKNINTYRFGRWKERRDFHKSRKRNALQANASALLDAADGNVEPAVAAGDGTLRPGLTGNVILITVPSMDNASKPHQKAFCLNPQGKTSVCILHDLVQKVLRCSVDYFYSETRNSATPYNCVAKLLTNCANSKLLVGSSIKDRLLCLQERYRLQDGQGPVSDDGFITVGEGCGISKKQARLMAAKKAVENLLGGIEFDSDGRGVTAARKSDAATELSQALSAEQVEENKYQIFDNLDVCDSRVIEWSARAGQPAPYVILKEYLKRNATFGDTEIRTNIRPLRFKKHRFDMHVGQSHHVSVDCGNKREGKQKAAQAMLSKFLPEFTTWGSILRLYGYEAQQKQMEAVKNKESIIKLQDEVRLQNEKIGSNIEPNNVILEKLKSEMMKISTDLVERQTKSAQKSNNLGVCPAKRARLEAAAGFAQLSAAQVEALEALLNVQKARLRNEEINFSDMPILDEGQLRDLSGKLSQIFPNSDVKVPSLF